MLKRDAICDSDRRTNACLTCIVSSVVICKSAENNCCEKADSSSSLYQEAPDRAKGCDSVI